MQGTNQHIGSNLGFSVLPKDTSTYRQEEPGFEPPTHGSLDDPLYLLIHETVSLQYSQQEISPNSEYSSPPFKELRDPQSHSRPGPHYVQHSPRTLNPKEMEDLSDMSVMELLRIELTTGYNNEAKYNESREMVYNCLRVPVELEKLMTFASFLCLDAFLYVFTLLPVRVLMVLPRFLLAGSRRLLQPGQVCDVLKGLILVVCFCIVGYVDYGMMYHMIRGQSVIKLYFVYSVLKVADCLFSFVGQHILDALYLTATETKRKKGARGLITHLLMAILYVFLHAIVILAQAATLSVAFNSHNKPLLAIMMSSNFVQIKGSMFKKCEKKGLFQISNGDIKERFTNHISLLIVCLRNMEQYYWNPDHLWVLFPNVVIVIVSEVVVDIVKHTFITNFNNIGADVYGEYRASLAVDLVSSLQKNAYTDYSDSLSRRMGFVSLTLAVVLINVVNCSVKMSLVRVLLFYLGMTTLKVLIGIVLRKSCMFVKEANVEEKKDE